MRKETSHTSATQLAGHPYRMTMSKYLQHSTDYSNRK